MTYDELVKANETINKVDVKGKQYAMVNDRVKAFRMLCPNGSINTEILRMEGGIVTMKATVKDEEGHILGTGLAQEKETSSYINKTSYIENCETSAVGRALGFAGIGVDGSMASAEEVANAILNQSTPAPKAQAKKEPQGNERLISSDEVTRLRNLCRKYDNMPEERLCAPYKKTKLSELTKKEWDDLYSGKWEEITKVWEDEVKSKAD